MKNNIYFLIRSLLISLLFLLLLPLLLFAQSLAPIPEVGPTVCAANCGSNTKPSMSSFCSNNCSGHGFCHNDGSCLCKLKWKGPDCSTSICSNNCSGHGRCRNNGSCHCYTEWTGDDCSTPAALPSPNTCSGRGFYRKNGGNGGICSPCIVDDGTVCAPGFHCISTQTCNVSTNTVTGEKKCQCNGSSAGTCQVVVGGKCSLGGTCSLLKNRFCCNGFACVVDIATGTSQCKRLCP